jgi:hypothetical protein
MIVTIAATHTTAPATACLANHMLIENLTPGPFPSGKGSKNGEVSVALGLCSPFPHRKGGEGDRTAPDSDNSGSPSHYGKGNNRARNPRATTERGLNTEKKGLGVRFLICALTLTAGCSQVHEKIFTLNCAINRRPLPGEMAPNTAMALDVSTSPIPLLFPAHRAIARCDNTGVVTFDIETPVETGISQLSTPLSTAASHITYAP